MVVLHQNNWIIGFCFFNNGLREFFVDRNILSPVLRSKDRTNVSNVA